MSHGKQIRHSVEILRLLEAIKLLNRVAVMHCRGRQRGDTDQEKGNRLADLVAERAAEEGEVNLVAIMPDGKIVSINSEISYSKEDLKAQLKNKMYVLPEGQIVVPE